MYLHELKRKHRVYHTICRIAPALHALPLPHQLESEDKPRWQQRGGADSTSHSGIPLVVVAITHDWLRGGGFASGGTAVWYSRVMCSGDANGSLDLGSFGRAADLFWEAVGTKDTKIERSATSIGMGSALSLARRQSVADLCRVHGVFGTWQMEIVCDSGNQGSSLSSLSTCFQGYL